MSKEEMIKALEEMENGERIDFLLWMYENHFNTMTPEQRRETSRVMEMYYNGELVEANPDGY